MTIAHTGLKVKVIGQRLCSANVVSLTSIKGSLFSSCLLPRDLEQHPLKDTVLLSWSWWLAIIINGDSGRKSCRKKHLQMYTTYITPDKVCHNLPRKNWQYYVKHILHVPSRWKVLRRPKSTYFHCSFDNIYYNTHTQTYLTINNLLIIMFPQKNNGKKDRYKIHNAGGTKNKICYKFFLSSRNSPPQWSQDFTLVNTIVLNNNVIITSAFDPRPIQQCWPCISLLHSPARPVLGPFQNPLMNSQRV